MFPQAGSPGTAHRVSEAGRAGADLPGLARAAGGSGWTAEVEDADGEVHLVVGPSPGLPRRGGRFASLLAAHRSVLTEAAACGVLLSCLGVATAFVVQHLVDFVLARGERSLLSALGLGLLLVLAFQAVFGLLRESLLAHVARKVDLELLGGFARRVLALPMRFYETRQVGEVLSRLHDAGKVRDAVGGAALAVVVDGCLVGTASVVLWCYDANLALVSVLFLPPLVAAVALCHRPARRRSQEAMERASELHARLVEDVTGVETIKALGLEEARAEEAEERIAGYVRSTFALRRIGVATSSFGLLLTGLASVVVLWYGGLRVIDGALTIGELLFFYTLFAWLIEPLERLASTSLQLQEARAAADRLFEVIEVATEREERRGTARFEGLAGSIRFEGVGFRYGEGPAVLDDLDLEIPVGSQLALVGESGSGKTTIVKLLLGLHAPGEGRILLDGVDVRDLDVETLRARIGVVGQDPILFTGTIRENLALGAPRATSEEVLRIARAVGLEALVEGSPDRFDTVLGERGATLSGGQRQRIAIARALLRRPDLLLLDEATSHLDTFSERTIAENLRPLLAGRTTLVVAHRLSTVRHADRIHYLHDGRIVESGTHEELVRLGGRYAQLWHMQERDADPAGRPALRCLRGIQHA